MPASTKLALLRVAHGVIFVTVVSATVFVAWAGIIDYRGPGLIAAIALVCVEAVFLAVNKLECPLTHLARRLGSSKGWALDIVMPESWANAAKWVFGAVFAGGIVLLVLRA